ncbi:scavenger receptor cysteine-rich type 1 protein M130-like [Acanthopagrus schlegelii]
MQLHTGRQLEMAFQLDMDRTVLVVFLSLWSSVVPDDVRLVGGAGRCAGNLEVNQQGVWKPVNDTYYEWNLTSAAAVCRQLDCGSVVSLRRTQQSSDILKLSAITDAFRFTQQGSASSSLEINCSDSVRLVNENSLCSGRLEVKSNQRWSSVCEDDFDQQDAEVVCRELGCGAPSVLQGALYGEVEAPMWTSEFQCGGHESALLDCRTSGSDRNTCSPGKAVGLTCSAPDEVRLAGGASQCSGTLEIHKLSEWKPVDDRGWNLRLAGVVCGQLDCGSAVSIRRRQTPPGRFIWELKSYCGESSPVKCLRLVSSSAVLEITCSDSVRLVNGNSLCSGRLEVKSNQRWSSVCEDDFDQQDAEVVCRELGCGAPSVLQGALYGEVEAPMWTREFQCGGHESALQDCRTSGSDRNTCSPGKAVGLTCSDPADVRLVGGTSHCTGRLEMKHREIWKAVDTEDSDWDQKATSVICRRLDCGSSVSTEKKKDSSEGSVWWINSSCVQSNSILRDCVTTREEFSTKSLEVTCSDSIRLVNGNSLCSGRLEVKSNQRWSSVCEDDFDQQDAEVVCRELGCGAPSVLQGALYGEVEAPMWTGEFQCGGHESALLDCRTSGSDRNTCSPGKAVGLTCSDPDNIRLVGKNSRCAGILEMKNNGQWRPVADWDSGWDQQSAATVCRLLDCGSVVSTETTDDAPDRLVWWIKASCVKESAPAECIKLTEDYESYLGLEVVCSDLLVEPKISPTPSTDGVSRAKQQGLQVLQGSNFTITCSIEPQYQGGYFQLCFTSSSTMQNYTQPAVNHSAHFPFHAADHTHHGEYSCVYHVDVFSYNFSSESQPLHLAVAAALTELIIRLVVLLLGLISLITALCCHSKACRI